MMDSHDRQLIVAHIESMRELTKAITLQSAALLEQNQVIAELVNAVGMLVEGEPEQDEVGADDVAGVMLMNGTRIS